MRGFITCLTAALSSAAYCGGKPDPNAKPNTLPIFTGPAVLQRSVPNGHAYQAGAPGYEFDLVHVYGSAYEMGFALGRLYPNDTQHMLNRTCVAPCARIACGS